MRVMPKLATCMCLVGGMFAWTCTGDTLSKGQLTVLFDWGELSPPTSSDGLWVWCRVEERNPSDPNSAGLLLRDADLVPWKDEGVDLQLGDIPNGKNRVVVVEFKTAESKDERVTTRYYGQSDLFELEPGINTTVEVPFSLAEVPDAQPSAEGALFVVEAVELLDTGQYYVNNPIVTLSIAPSSAAYIEIANDPLFSRNLVSASMTNRPSQLTEAGNRLWWAGWDLNAAVCGSTTGVACLDGARTVYLRYRDEYGNESQAHSAPVFLDTTPPPIISATVAYLPGPDNPLPSPRLARAGTTVVVTLGANEPLSEVAPMEMQADNNATTLFFQKVESTTAGAIFEVEVPPTAENGVYVPRVTWSDAVGNTTESATFDDPLIVVVTLSPVAPTDLPSLTVDQSNVIFVRSVWGNATDESLGTSYTIPAGPYFALAPAEPLSDVATLTSSVFAMSTTDVASGALGSYSGAPTMVRVWGDDTFGSLMGTMTPNQDGSWPRLQLTNLDVPFLFATAVDRAGNESQPQLIEYVEWVATPNPPGYGESPHALAKTGYVRGTRVPDELSTTVGITGADGTTVASSAAQRLWRDVTPTAEGPSARARAAISFDVARGRVVLFGGDAAGNCDGGATNECPGTWERYEDRWSLISNQGPEARYDHAMAFDSARGRVVLFGGYTSSGDCHGNGSSFCSDTWEWDGRQWTRVDLAGTGPIARSGHAMAYDSARAKIVLHGGYDGTDFLEDTWEWDGKAWEWVSSGGPGTRASHAMTYDATHEQLLLFGGWCDAGDEGDLCPDGTSSQRYGYCYPGDTWQWDGADWTVLATTGPEGRRRHGMAYDSSAETVLMFGGEAYSLDANLCDDGDNYRCLSTWEWNGASWGQLASLETYMTNREDLVVFDTVLDRVIMFSGADTWEWDGDMWTVVSTDIPVGRSAAAMAYDESRKKTVMYGGSSDYGSTWEWDGGSWAENLSAGGPTAESAYTMAYDSSRSKLVLTGGGYAGDGSTWEWATTGWVQSATASPIAVYLHAMAYDPGNEEIVLFGGRGPACAGNSGGYCIDTWVWNGSDWLVAASSGPQAREGAAMARNVGGNGVIMLGGQYGPSDCGAEGYHCSYTWHWNGSVWQQIDVPGPEPRTGAAMAYDWARDRVILVGGSASPVPEEECSPRLSSGSCGDMWEWDGTSWTELPLRGPQARSAHSMAYDGVREKVLLYGGNAAGLDCYAAGSSTCPDAWVYDAAPDRSPAIQFDAAARAYRVLPDEIVGLQVRAECSGQYYPYGAGDTEAELYGWSTGESTLRRGAGWAVLPTNASGSMMSWTAADADESRSFFVERDAELSFQCRPAGPSGPGYQEATVEVDYIEVRVRYRVEDVGR